MAATCRDRAVAWHMRRSGRCLPSASRIANALFSMILKPVTQSAVDAFLNALTLFGLGYSWGGFESLMIQFDCSEYRTATRWNPGGPALRLHVGLEDPEDLQADLDQAFAA